MTDVTRSTWRFYDQRGALKVTDPTSPAPPPDPLPIGLIQMFVTMDAGTPVVPTNWLLCDGDDHLIATYPDLAGVLGSSFQTPAPAGGEFRVPNLNTAFPVGTGAGFPLGVQDYSLLRSQHSHSSPFHQGAITGTNHVHSFEQPASDHIHTIPAHKHNYAHEHTSLHRHQVGTLNVVFSSSSKLADDTNALLVADGSHKHEITGGLSSSHITDVGANLLSGELNTGNDPIDTAAQFGGNSAGTVWSPDNRTEFNFLVDNLAAPNILPPYLNTFFIIKAASDL